MTEAEWKAAYIKRFLAGPWDEGDMTQDADMIETARESANEAWADDPDADPDDAAIYEWSCWAD